MSEQFQKPNRLERFKTLLQITIAINILIVAGVISYSLFTQQKLDDSLLISNISAEYKKELEDTFGQTQPTPKSQTHYATNPQIELTYNNRNIEVFQGEGSLWLIYEFNSERYLTEISQTEPTISGDLEEIFKDGAVQYRHDILEDEEYLLITKAIGSNKIYLSTTAPKIPAKDLYAYLDDIVGSIKLYEPSEISNIPLTFSKHGTTLSYSPLKWLRVENTIDKLLLTSYESTPNIFYLSFSAIEDGEISQEDLEAELSNVVLKYELINKENQWKAGDIQNIPVGDSSFVSQTATMQYMNQNWERTIYIGTTPNVNTLITIVTTQREGEDTFASILSSFEITDSEKPKTTQYSMQGKESLKISQAEYMAAHSTFSAVTTRCDTVTLINNSPEVPDSAYTSCTNRQWVATSNLIETDYPLVGSVYKHPLLVAKLKESAEEEITPQNIDTIILGLIKDGAADSTQEESTVVIGSKVEIDELTNMPFTTPNTKEVTEISEVRVSSISSQILSFSPLQTSLVSLSPIISHESTVASNTNDPYNTVQFSNLGQLVSQEDNKSAEYSNILTTFISLQRREYDLALQDKDSILLSHTETLQDKHGVSNKLDLRQYESLFEPMGLQFNNQKLVLIALSLSLLVLNIILIVITSIISFVLRRSDKSPTVGDPFAKENLLKNP